MLIGCGASVVIPTEYWKLGGMLAELRMIVNTVSGFYTVKQNPAAKSVDEAPLELLLT